MYFTYRLLFQICSWICFSTLLLSYLPIVSGASLSKHSSSNEKFIFLVFSEKCFDSFLAGDFWNIPCIKQTISKCIGYAIITGACIVKFPQIIAFIRAGSVAGASRESAYFELIGYALTVVYHLINASPFSAYGEAIVVTIQAVVIVLMMWAYEFPGITHVSGAIVTLAVLVQGAIMAGTTIVDGGHPYLAAVQGASTLLFIISRVAQIWENIRSQSTGTLALLTLIMNAGGSAARIFTAIVEVRDRPEVFISFAISTFLNMIILVQYFWYWGKSNTKVESSATTSTSTKRKTNKKTN